MNRLKLQRKSSITVSSKFAIVSIFIALKYIQNCHKTIWQQVQQKYSLLEGDLFYPQMIRVCRFDGTVLTCFYYWLSTLASLNTTIMIQLYSFYILQYHK